jgi:protein-lysine N-methyltransferase EEF2KMT
MVVSLGKGSRRQLIRLQDVSDELMTTLAALLAQRLPSELEAIQQKSYHTYYLSTLEARQPEKGPGNEELLDGPFITLLETSAILSGSGTTGLRTWEAALYLGDYLCSNPATVTGKRVLELGAGTGYISILCAKHLGALQVIASDGSDDVVNSLPDNFFLNGLQDDTAISRMDMKWGHAIVGTEEAEWNGGRQIDLVLGADILYDPTVQVPLMGTLDELFDMFPAMEVLIAAMIRNEETFERFGAVCQARGYLVEYVDFPLKRREEQDGPFYASDLPMRICRLSKQRSKS